MNDLHDGSGHVPGGMGEGLSAPEMPIQTTILENSIKEKNVDAVIGLDDEIMPQAVMAVSPPGSPHNAPDMIS